jgi:hypothetical protein
MTKQLRIGLRILPLICLAIAGMNSGSAFAQQQASALKPCPLDSAGDKIKHVVQIIFDNVHLRRDNPTFPRIWSRCPTS